MRTFSREATATLYLASALAQVLGAKGDTRLGGSERLKLAPDL